MFTVLEMRGQDYLPITDINGQVYQIQRPFLEWVLIIAWVFQCLAEAANLLSYLVHPMKVDTDIRSKMFIYVLGSEWSSLYKGNSVLLL